MQSLNRKYHERSPLSAITREMEIIRRDITRITNHIQADITAIFPEYTSAVAIDSKTGIAILEKYTVPEKLLKFMQKNGRNHFESEIGSIEQFESAVKLLSFGGKAPDMSGSAGKIRANGIWRTRNSHLSNAVHESAVSLVLHRNQEFYGLFTRELMKRKSKTEAYIVVGKRLLFHVYSMMKNSRPYRERKPGNSDRGRGSLPVQ
jgi:hypothetical protein